MIRTIYFITLVLLCTNLHAQNKGTDATAPLHALQPDYPVPGKVPAVEEVKQVLDRVYNYLEKVTPFQLTDRRTSKAWPDGQAVDTNTIFQPGDFRLTSYEWGVTYSGMLAAGLATGDTKFTRYTTDRLGAIAKLYPEFKALYQRYPKMSNPLRQPVEPKALDDAGAVCASMIKTLRNGGDPALRPIINHLSDYVFKKEYRLKDGTLARNRPQPNTLWLDDMYMGVPALAQLGALTGDRRYFDDCVNQVKLFSGRMFNKDLKVYMHGWVEGMKEHPEFHWARANGWALMAMTELLDVLPKDHPGRKDVLLQFQKHAKGLASFQSGQGFWHQLLDRSDSYLETSSTAIYTYCIARGINNGWIDAKAYGPMCLLAWNAVTTKVNAQGQVEGTCVGTGMAFDPMFYYYRPVNVYAAHGYGPVLLAGSEIIQLLKKYNFGMNDSSIQLLEK